MVGVECPATDLRVSNHGCLRRTKAVGAGSTVAPNRKNLCNCARRSSAVPRGPTRHLHPVPTVSRSCPDHEIEQPVRKACYSRASSAEPKHQENDN